MPGHAAFPTGRDRPWKLAKANWMHNHVKCSYVSNGWRMFQAWFTAARSSTARPFLLLKDPGDLGALRTY